MGPLIVRLISLYYCFVLLFSKLLIYIRIYIYIYIYIRQTKDIYIYNEGCPNMGHLKIPMKWAERHWYRVAPSLGFLDCPISVAQCNHATGVVTMRSRRSSWAEELEWRMFVVAASATVVGESMQTISSTEHTYVYIYIYIEREREREILYM